MSTRDRQVSKPHSSTAEAGPASGLDREVAHRHRKRQALSALASLVRLLGRQAAAESFRSINAHPVAERKE